MHFFCSLDVLEVLYKSEFEYKEADVAVTVSVPEIPYWFSFMSREEEWILKTYSQTELFALDMGMVFEKGNLVVNKETGEGEGTTTVEMLKDHMEIIFKACKSLSNYAKEESFAEKYADLDIEESGILLTATDEKLSYQVVTGKERPELACSTLTGNVVVGRPYMEDFWERSRLDLLSWEEILELADVNDEEAMEKAFLSYLNGVENWNYTVEQDPEKAVYWLERMAEVGSSNGMFNLGLHYAKGFGVQRDFTKAAYWMERAVEAGDDDALKPAKEYRRLSTCLESAQAGDAQAQADLAGSLMALGGSLDQAGPGKDFEESFLWAEKSAAQGNGEGLWVLALAYEHGRGIEKNLEEAVRIYVQGAELGHAKSQHSLGCYYARGEVVEQDHRKAFELFKKSAEQGNGLAMRDLGRCYQFGSGTIGNMKTALEWYEKAIEIIDDPELERKVEVFRCLAQSDEHWNDDYIGNYCEEDFGTDKYMTGLVPEAISEAWKYEDELDMAGYMPEAMHGEDSWEDLPRVHQKALEGDERAIKILAAL